MAVSTERRTTTKGGLPCTKSWTESSRVLMSLTDAK